MRFLSKNCAQEDVALCLQGNKVFNSENIYIASNVSDRVLLSLFVLFLDTIIFFSISSQVKTLHDYFKIAAQSTCHLPNSSCLSDVLFRSKHDQVFTIVKLWVFSLGFELSLLMTFSSLIHNNRFLKLYVILNLEKTWLHIFLHDLG